MKGGRPVLGRGRTASVVAAAVLVAGSACDNSTDRQTRGTSAPVAAAIAGRVDVLAASSLTEAFAEMGRAFEAGHPGTEVVFNFGASSTLARQLDEGAPADVFASADEATMNRVTDAGVASDSTVMARNRLAIMVERGNPKAIQDVQGLARSDVILVLCALQVPCGRLGAAVLERAGVDARPASLEENVKGVVSKVTLGEADAGIVYLTDVEAAGDAADGVAIAGADAADLEAVYPIAPIRSSSHPEAARAWVDFTLSPAGQSILARFGFLPP